MAQTIVAQSHTHQSEQLRLLIEQRISDAFASLWPSSLPMPAALTALQDAVIDLATFAGCAEQDRERTYKRLLRLYTGNAPKPAQPDDSSLLHIPNAPLAVPGLLAMLAGHESDLEPAGFVEAVDAWLAGPHAE